MSKSVEELLQENNDLLRGQQSNRGYGGNSGSAFSQQTKEGFGLFDAALVTTGGTLGKAAEAVRLLSGALNQYEQDWQKASNIGISFNNNIAEFSTSIAQTRMNTQEFFTALQAGRDGLKINVTALGGTVGEATRNFALLSKDMTTSFGDPLKYMGYSTEEYNEVLALTITNQKGYNAESKDPAARAAREHSLLAAADLAGEMDKMAKLTGVSREAQRQRVLQDSQDGQLQATLALMQQRGAQDAAGAFNKMTTDMSFLGKAGQDAAKNIFNGGEMTKETINTLQAMGPASAEFTAAVNATKAAAISGDKAAQEQAQKRIEALQPLITNAIRSSGSLTFASTNNSNEVAKSVQSLLVSSNMYNKALEANQQELNEHKNVLGDITAAELANRKAQAEQQGKEYVYDEVKKEYVTRVKEGTDTTKALIQTQARAADMEAKLAEGINALNNTLSKSDFIKNIVDKTKNTQTDEKGKTTTGLDRAGLINTTGLNDIIAGITKGDYKAVIEGVGKTGKDVLTNIGDFAISVMKGMVEPVTTVGNSLTGKRDGGTYKETGSPIEQQDSIVKIHKGETVFSPESTKNLGEQLQQMAEKSLQMPFVTGSYKPTPVTDQFSPSNKDIKNTVSESQNTVRSKSENELLIERDKLNQQNTRINEPTSKPPYPAELQKIVDIMTKGGGLDSNQMKIMGSFGDLGSKAYNDAKIAQLKAQDEATPKENKTSVADVTEKLKTAAKKKEEDDKRRAEVAPPGEASYTPFVRSKESTTATTVMSPTSATLDDLKNQLEMLNKSMGILVNETHALVDHTGQQVRATKRMDPNVNLRG